MRGLLFGLWALGLASVLPCAAAVPVADVVVHAQSTTERISRPLLRGIFGMRVRNWPDGTPVTVFVLEDANPTHSEFCKSVLMIYPYQLRQDWDRLVYSGTGQPPVTVASEPELRRLVAETPGAIGYLGSAAKVEGAKIKVLNVQ